jgi:N-acetylglucosaminyldiphosphoundecaprenol N-acetyl-beta-D-mannosaminyltransferase
VSLDCPKQEIWIANIYRQISAVLAGIGGVFPAYGRLRKRAPLWMQKMVLEWLFRILQEPRRMFKRYLVSNTLFIALILSQWFNLKIQKKTANLISIPCNLSLHHGVNPTEALVR